MIRVLRVLEYEYEDLDAYEYDSSLWTTSFNNLVGRSLGSHKVKMVSQVVRISELGDNNDS